MLRTDSAFDDTFRLKDTETGIARINRSETTPSRPRNSKKTSSNLQLASQSPTRNTRRPASEKRSTTHRKTDTRRKSITSSSDDSTRKGSRRRGHGSSLPSSRRTSCTIVDPSRPARHYRIKSSQTCPTITRDVDDVLALHFRSCSLFQNPTYQSSNLPSPTISGHGAGANADFSSMRAQKPDVAPHFDTDDIEQLSPKASEETVAPPNTTMHWMSPSTRRTQYEKIDRAHSGLRGFMRKLMPRCMSGPPPQRFYENDKSDAGSVRRYRMDVEDEEHDDDKSISALKLQHRKPEKSMERKVRTKTTRWGCF